MRKVLCFIATMLLVSGVSAQAWQKALVGVTVGLKNANKQVQQVTQQAVQPVKMAKPVQPAADLKELTVVDVRQYFNGNTFISFSFSNGFAKTSLEDGSLSTLIPLRYSARGAEPDEKVFQGTSKLGHGLYYFAKDHSRLRIVLDTQDTLIFKSLPALKPLKVR